LRLRIFDAVVLGFAAAVTVYWSVLIYAGNDSPVQLVVKGEGGNWIYPIGRTERVEVPGPLGITVVELYGGEARVLSSPCANQSCVAAGAIHKRGQWAACLPNRVFLSVEGGSVAAPSGVPDGAGDLDGSAW
jgi:hypothetical protein